VSRLGAQRMLTRSAFQANCLEYSYCYDNDNVGDDNGGNGSGQGGLPGCLHGREPRCSVLVSLLVWEIWTCRHSICCEATVTVGVVRLKFWTALIFA